MDFQILLTNLTNPTLLFFVLGMLATWVKSDLEVPQASSKFISLYLLFSIGFKGGQELAHHPITDEIIRSLILGVLLSGLIPIYTFFILKKKVGIENAGAIAAAYGSVSAVTFVAASTFLDIQQISYGGHTVAVMALMEAPAIVIGVVLIRRYLRRNGQADMPQTSLRSLIFHSFTNGSVLLILGSLFIGLVADAKQAEGIKPFTTDIFKGFLAIFLLEMGMVTARRLATFWKYGLFVTLFAIFIPAFNGCLVAFLSAWVTNSPGDRFMLAILAASASYIAVPAAMRLAAPSADPGLYIPMALGVTFPFNITVGMPLYMAIIEFYS
jgi:uncharacterized protein